MLNTLVDFAVFYVMDRWVIGEGPTFVLLGTRVAAGLYISNAIAYAAANIHSFIWNKFWTFQKRDRVTRGEAARYLATSAGYLLISSLGLDRAGPMGQPAGQAAHSLRHHLLQLSDEQILGIQKLKLPDRRSNALRPSKALPPWTPAELFCLFSPRRASVSCGEYCAYYLLPDRHIHNRKKEF